MDAWTARRSGIDEKDFSVRGDIKVKRIMKIAGKFVWILFCAVVFIAVFAVSILGKLSNLTGIDAKSFTLQIEATEEVKYTGEIERETYTVPYITNEGAVEEREIMLLKPEGQEGDLPLIYIPHYAIEENTAEFQQYMSHGWAVASPVFENEYNGVLTGNDLVFNNAALYTLRHMEGIDTQRIAIVGGSAGGYMSLMLNELQMGSTASIANSPIANVYYNLYVYFKACDVLNGNAGLTDIPMPIQLLVSKSFRSNLSNFPDVEDADRWAALSPIGNVKSISNPVVVNHYTADILVPVDQISKQYTYAERDEAFTEDFPIMMGDDYPGILSHSLEEEADPAELSLAKYELEDNHIDMDMPFSDKLLTINIFDDGPMDSKGSHASPTTTGSMDTIPYLEEMFAETLKETEKAVPEKLLLMIERYQGKSVQLPAHTGVDDTVYGSLAVYQSEVLDELAAYVENHSLEELDRVAVEAADLSEEPEEVSITWKEIRKQLSGN